jgi:8-oxo-dGTP pyrophosphatase MutT (NUDIX family)
MSIAAGIFFYALSTKRFLFLLRSETKKANSWGIPGGTIEDNETLLEGLQRECMEEIGIFPDNLKLIPIQKFVNNSFTYHTFYCEIKDEFIPKLNIEHCGYAWVGENNYPKPLHPGLFSTINLDIVQEKIKILIEKKKGT